jgi:hypothetical protein
MNTDGIEGTKKDDANEHHTGTCEDDNYFGLCWVLKCAEDLGGDYAHWEYATTWTFAELPLLMQNVSVNRMAFHLCKPLICRVWNPSGDMVIECGNKDLLERVMGLPLQKSNLPE